MKHYEVSVVTPFHNVDLDIFQTGIEFMKAQTYGFENIEWIVVAHNCAPEYKEGVHRLLDGYPNVIVKDLDNDRRTPSSPRNYGLSLATGDYVGFLDGDDSYTPECFEVVVEAMKRNKAQVTVFRREFELENPDDIPVTEIVLWDQMEKEILIDKDHWDDVKMFSGICGMVTSRVYDRRFLEENGIVFDESVLFAEDYLFNLEAYGRLDRVLYLPQFIGYHYFINGGSLVQSGDKSPETLINYAKGYAKVFETGLNFGFYMNAIISRLCVVLARFLSQSTSISLEQRRQIGDILAPYINKTTMMEPSKVYSHKVVKESYDIPRNVILHPEEWLANRADALLISDNEAVSALSNDNAKTLTRILEENQQTDMGRHYAFWDIQTVDAYRRCVPLSDYSDLKPLLKLTTRIGESNIFTAGEIAAYIEEETSEEQYRIFPLLRRSAKGNARAFSLILKGHRTILLPDKVKGGMRKYNDDVYANTTAGTVTAGLFSHQSGIFTPTVTAPEALYFTTEDYDTRYLHLLFALRDKKADQLVQPKCRWTLHVFEYIKENWKVLCDDIAHGSVSMGEPLPDSLRQLAEKHLTPDEARADELRKVFGEGFDTPVANRIWPDLRGVYTNKGGDEAAYQTLTSKYLGQSVPCRDMYFETCGTVVGHGHMSKDGYCLKLLNKVAFFEFIPEAEADKDKKEIATLLIPELSSGERYELVITTDSGMYRFRTGRLIRILDVEDGSVCFSY
ncbi:MAG: GH3 auxin-responsive promoter family protein [Lachnospiraceae bacterium]|nr:GH3 auxin-responsive promoter family protein [Lachnospiraceae bacterium]